MSDQTKREVDVFRPQTVGEIVDELGSLEISTDSGLPASQRKHQHVLTLEDSSIVRRLVDLRLSSSPTLRQRVREITDTEHLQHIGTTARGRHGRMLPLLPRFMLRAGAVISVLLVAVFLLTATVPSARAAFGRMMQQRFGLLLVEPMLETTPLIESQDNPGVQTEIIVIEPNSFDEVQAKVPFPIPMPESLPHGLVLWATHMTEYPPDESIASESEPGNAEPQIIVVLTYRPVEDSAYHPSATLVLNMINQINFAGGYAIAAGAEESIAVGGQPAIFARGSWDLANENAPPDLTGMVWDGNTDEVMLSWEAGGFTYTLRGHFLGLSREQYIQIAESVH